MDEYSAPEYRGYVVEYDDQPNELTIYPDNVDGEKRMQRWLSAEGSSFVDLDDWR